MSETPAPVKRESATGSAVLGRPFARGADPRRGRGPQKGAPNAGPPPDELRALARAGLLPFIERCLRIIAEGPDELAIRAGVALFKVSGLERLELTGTLDSRVVGVLMVPATVSAEEWSGVARRQQAAQFEREASAHPADEPRGPK